MGDRKIVGVEDLVLISEVSDKGIVNNLQKRFGSDDIYTYLGNVLIVCNPFKWLPLYDNNYVKMFNNGIIAELEPHIYAISETGFKQMLLEEMNQCVIISGESGAGKTEAAKQIMSYIAAVSGSGGNDIQVNKVKNIILDSNPALESFGNAMTLRNNNSSRFGKYFEITFTPTGTPMGGKITNFLLERGRLANLSPGERSFHIFYQLVFANMPEMKNALALSNNPNDYTLLAKSGTLTVDNEGGRRNDGEDMMETVSSLETVNIMQKGQFNLFMIVATVLHLSNVDFRDKKINGAEGSELGSQRAQQALQNVAHVLQIDANELLYNLTNKNISTVKPGRGVETYQVPQNAVQATATRDSLVKDLYARMFDLLVNKVNESLKIDGGLTRASVRRQKRAESMRAFDDTNLSIGVLDIYGFEIFHENFFEQFCINYVNEKLQQVFIELTIRAEQEDYEAEGIAWNKIPFFDNKIVCDLIEGGGAKVGKKKFGKGAAANKAGVFAILDDTAKTVTAMQTGAADRRFGETLVGMHGSHPHLKQSATGFTIMHYAGDVKYNVTGFVDANRDTLSKETVLMLQKSQRKFIKALYPEQIDFNDKTQPPSMSSKIRRQANELIETLKQCEPHYVRCIKSNHRKAPKVFENDMVVHQVRYLNLLENVKIRRAGFAYRVKFLDFNKRFKVLGADRCTTDFYARATPMQITTVYMEAAAERLQELRNPGEVQFGNTKLFIKTPEVLFALQKIRHQMLGEVAAKIQRFYRYFKAQKKLFSLKTMMIALFENNGKPMTPVDVLGNFQSYYIDNPRVKQDMDEILNYYKEQGIVQETVKYTERLQRVNKDIISKLEDVLFVMTDQAIYIMRYETEMVIQKNIKNLFSRRTTVVEKRNEMGEVETKLQLKKRVPLKDVSEILLTNFPDDFLKIGCSTSGMIKPDKSQWVDKKSVKRCMQSQEPFTFFGKSKHRCHYTGGLYIKELMCSQPVPDKGFYLDVEVLSSVSKMANTEMQEDIIINTEHKAEITATLMELLNKARGMNLEQQYNQGGMQGMLGGGAIQPRFAAAWTVSGAEPLGVIPRGQVNFQMAPQIRDVMINGSEMPEDESITVMVPSNGVTQERQARLKAFLYRREERKNQKAQNRRAQQEQVRMNNARFQQEDKELRAKQRAEKKMRRMQKNNGKSNFNGAPALPSKAFSAPNNNPGFGAPQPKASPFMTAPSIPQKSFGGNDPPAIPHKHKKKNGSFGGNNGPPAIPQKNGFGSSQKSAFGGGQQNGFGNNAPPPIPQKTSFGGSQKNGFGATPNAVPKFGNNAAPSMPVKSPYAGTRKTSHNQVGGKQNAVPDFSNGNGASKYGAQNKPNVVPNFGASNKFGAKPNGGAVPSFGNNNKLGGVKPNGAPVPNFGGSNKFGGNGNANGGASKYGAQNKPNAVPSFGNKPAAGGFGAKQNAVPNFGNKPAGGGFGAKQNAVPNFGNKPSGGAFGAKPNAVPTFNKPAGGFGGGPQPKPSPFMNQAPVLPGFPGQPKKNAVPNFGAQPQSNGFGAPQPKPSPFMNQMPAMPPPPVPKKALKPDYRNDPNWERVLDDNTGRYYFYNYNTDESVWDENM